MWGRAPPIGLSPGLARAGGKRLHRAGEGRIVRGMRELLLTILEELRDVHRALGDRGRGERPPRPSKIFQWDPQTGRPEILPAVQAQIDRIPPDSPTGPTGPTGAPGPARAQ